MPGVKNTVFKATEVDHGDDAAATDGNRMARTARLLVEERPQSLLDFHRSGVSQKTLVETFELFGGQSWKRITCHRLQFNLCLNPSDEGEDDQGDEHQTSHRQSRWASP